MSSADQSAIMAALESSYAKMPKLAMVDSDKGITNLHVSSDVIIDASMPVVVRDSGKMWNKARTLGILPHSRATVELSRSAAAPVEACAVWLLRPLLSDAFGAGSDAKRHQPTPPPFYGRSVLCVASTAACSAERCWQRALRAPAPATSRTAKRCATRSRPA
eukprot:2753827-Pleurochrysis_carterae.AAC.1